MTTYTFIGNASQQFVSWDDPSVWSGGMFPDSSNADVIFPLITTSGGSTYRSFVTIANGQSYLADSVQITSNTLTIDGTLTVGNAVSLMTGGEIDMSGTLSAGSLSLASSSIDIQGNGAVTVSGAISNAAEIIGSGLTVTGGGLSNSGALIAASGNLTVVITSGGFTNLSGSTVTGGAYSAGFAGNTSPNTLFLNIGAVITDDAANFSINGGGAIESYDGNGMQYVPLQSSLTTIASSGTLSLAAQTYNWVALTDDGTLALSSATFNAPALTVGTGAVVSGAGTIAATISNNGTIIAGVPASLSPPSSDLLEITGNVTGTGTLEVGPGFTNPSNNTRVDSQLELNGTGSEKVIFTDHAGTLILAAPNDLSGSIVPGAGGNIQIFGTSFSAVTGYGYSGNSSSGMLTVQTTGGTITLNFLGDLDTADFTLSAGPQPLSNSPASLMIAVVGRPVINAASAAGYVEGGLPSVVSPSLTVTNASNLVGGTVRIGGGTFAGDGDLLSASTTGTPITASYSSSTETLTLSGAATFAQYQSVLDSVTFSSSATDPTDGGADPTRTITWTVNDGSDSSDPVVTTLHIVAPNPAPPAATTEVMIMDQSGSGDYEIYDMGQSSFLAAYPIAQISASLQAVELGAFNGSDLYDMLMRNTSTGEFWMYDVSGNNITAATDMGNVGTPWSILGFGDFSGNAGETDMLMRDTTGNLELYDIANGQFTGFHNMQNIGVSWQVLGFGDFSGNAGESDMLMRDSATGNLELYDITNNQYTGFHNMQNIGTSWQVLGFGDFSGNAGESDMLMRDSATGNLELYDITNNQYTGFHNMQNIGTSWQVLGFGDFSGNAGESDMLMRDSATGNVELYDINHNQYTGFFALGNIGLAWSVVAIGDFSGNAGEADMLMRNGNTGEFELYDITGNTITKTVDMGNVGPEWSAIGVADPPAGAQGGSTNRLAQAMASFAPATTVENNAPLTLPSATSVSQQPLTPPPHG